jgi:hypothetical protein
VTGGIYPFGYIIHKLENQVKIDATGITDPCALFSMQQLPGILTEIPGSLVRHGRIFYPVKKAMDHSPGTMIGYRHRG